MSAVPAVSPDHGAPLPAAQVHDRLRSALDDLRDAERKAVLLFAEIRARGLFRDLGYSSIEQYAQVALGFSRGRTWQFIRLAERFQELPELRRSVEEGSVSWTKARVVASVATPATESHWLEEARTKGRREIERQAEAARARGRAARRRPVGQASLLDSPESLAGSHAEVAGSGQESVSVDRGEALPEVPVEMVLRMRPEQYARFEALLARARGQGVSGDRVEILLAGLDVLINCGGLGAGVPARASDSNAELIENTNATRGAPASTSPAYRISASRSPYQIHVMVCPKCNAGEIPSTRGPLPVSLVDLATIACDACVELGGRNRAAIPPKLRRQVMARDRYTCQGAGCGRTRFLDVHHRSKREHGGRNAMENLITLCNGCHRVLHDLEFRLASRRGQRVDS